MAFLTSTPSATNPGASLPASAGALPAVLKEHMGHSTIKLTMDTYGHLFDTDREKVGAALGLVPALPVREAGYQRPQTSATVRETEGQTAMASEKPRSGEWSHGESNPDLLNAIQQIDLRKSNISKGIYRSVDVVLPGAKGPTQDRYRHARTARQGCNLPLPGGIPMTIPISFVCVTTTRDRIRTVLEWFKKHYENEPPAWRFDAGDGGDVAAGGAGAGMTFSEFWCPIHCLHYAPAH